jgi:site-specific recombinase XerD
VNNIAHMKPRHAESMRDLVDAFIASKGRSLGKKSAKTIRAYGFDLERFLAASSGIAACEVRAVDLERHLSQLCKSDGTPVAPATANRHLATLASFFSWLVDRGTIESSPVKGIKPAKLKSLEPGALDPAVRSQLVERAKRKGTREHALVVLLLATGVRIAEALDLDVGDVQLEALTLVVKTGKGDKARTGCYTTDTRAVLKRYLKERAAGTHEPLFTSSRGSRLSYQRAASVFKEIAGDLRNVDGSPLHLHQLRHSFATEQLGKGMNPTLLMTLTGHSDPRTLGRYTLAAKEAAAEAEFRRHNH